MGEITKALGGGKVGLRWSRRGKGGAEREVLVGVSGRVALKGKWVSGRCTQVWCMPL